CGGGDARGPARARRRPGSIGIRTGRSPEARERALGERWLISQRIRNEEDGMSTIEVADLKRVHRATWAAGDYAAVSDAITDVVVPQHLLDRIGVEREHELLDVATGTGNLALRAALAGANATGVDLTPELLETARRRASDLDLAILWVEGDAE